MKASDQRAFTRRRALKLGSLATIGSAVTSAWSRPIGSNADVRLGFAGLRNKGADHLNQFRTIPGCRIVALCDADSKFLDREKANCEKAKEQVTTYTDFRKMLANPDIDAVVIASPNHWHAVMGTWALEAGKHIYVEKPLAHSIWEGDHLVAAADKAGLIAQIGTQRRSDLAYAEAKEWLDSGALGAIRRAKVVIYRRRKRVEKRATPTQLPPSLDYDLWCGPAQVETLYRNTPHYDWHWVWNTGNGELSNNGIHFIDTARWLLGDPGLPKRTLSIGGRYGWDGDAGQTPNTLITLFEGDVPMICEVRSLSTKSGMKAMDHDRGLRMGTLIECEDGYLAWPVAYDKDGKKVKKFDSDDGHGHGLNWLQAIVKNKPNTLHAPIRNGQISTAYCHLGNLSHRLGAASPQGQIAEELSADADTASAVETMSEHLRAHDIDTASQMLTLGRVVTTDGVALSGASAADAKKIDERPLRDPYSFGKA